MDTLGFEPRAFRMRSGCDTTTPCARLATVTIQMRKCLKSGHLGIARGGANG